MKASFTLVLAACFTLALASAADFEAHEWGTFTTVSDSDGNLLIGLETEEEHLPGFVHNLNSRSGVGNPRSDYPHFHYYSSGPNQGFGFMSKGLPVNARNVTVKMETPVIYFYSENKEPFPVEVKVGFQGGAISEWYPDRSGGEPKLGYTVKDKRLIGRHIDFGDQKWKGAIEWKVDILPPSDSSNLEVVKAGDTATWVHPRLPDSNVVVNPASPYEKEKYLFYRGVGNFDLPIAFRQTTDRDIEIDSDVEVPFALVFQRNAIEVRYKILEGIPTGKTDFAFAEDEPFVPIDDVKIELLGTFRDALVANGLNTKEAEAMLMTWWRSYFSHMGTRVFWIVPRDVVDQILPIEITPAPKSLERVIVGRSELLSPAFEDKIHQEFSKENQDENQFRQSRYFKTYEARFASMKAAE